ncbi:TetR/AcrR family transcriptional regulator [Paenibacillus sp. NEAU-GSW1]|uniref:TetR/AcrR family transcriptional regulator n=1 Tax=Paenibacillus sp. NEAU-GSW1 TaxID=2682486 RepID=UPI0012E1AD7E|nr:TetR/AcrR family transcriptional regulator [Paenibacillus sp. NEAU-GSW1]MUT67445.1 TetR family transcriptional regulator [Paenibacillus sp. NEAU-GSW1]
MARPINEELRREKRALICDAARRLFAANGFTLTTVSNIAKEAGISHASVFTYFSSKEELIHSLVLEPLEESLMFYESIISEHNEPIQTLRKLIEVQMRSVIEQGTYLRLFQQVLGQPKQFPELTRALTDFGEQFVNLLEPLIRKGQESGKLSEGDAKVIGWTYFAYFNGAGLIYLDLNDGLAQFTVEGAMRIFGLRA